ncbi:MAG: hypothetical protein LBL21_04020 [Rickettsiales bacterium]|nr:hypothetical protein [Rickettsiales bacterium]
MKKMFLLFAAILMCYGAAHALQCEPETNFLITDASSCPCGYLNATSAPKPLSCPGTGSWTSTPGTFKVTCS